MDSFEKMFRKEGRSNLVDMNSYNKIEYAKDKFIRKMQSSLHEANNIQ